MIIPKPQWEMAALMIGVVSVADFTINRLKQNVCVSLAISCAMLFVICFHQYILHLMRRRRVNAVKFTLWNKIKLFYRNRLMKNLSKDLVVWDCFLFSDQRKIEERFEKSCYNVDNSINIEAWRNKENASTDKCCRFIYEDHRSFEVYQDKSGSLQIFEDKHDSKGFQVADSLSTELNEKITSDFNKLKPSSDGPYISFKK
jgi:hypothetical protein